MAGLSAHGITSVLPPWGSWCCSWGSASQEQAPCVLHVWASLCCCEAQGADKLVGDVAGRSLGGAVCRTQAGGGRTGCLTSTELGPVLKQPADPGSCHCLEFMWMSGVPRFQLSELLSLGQLRTRVGDRLYCFQTFTCIDMARWLRSSEQDTGQGGGGEKGLALQQYHPLGLRLPPCGVGVIIISCVCVFLTCCSPGCLGE